MCKWTFVWRLFESGKETWIGSAVEVGRVPFGGEVEVMVPLNFCGFEMDFLWNVCFYEMLAESLFRIWTQRPDIRGRRTVAANAWARTQRDATDTGRGWRFSTHSLVHVRG